MPAAVDPQSGDLWAFFRPNSVAIVGASGRSENLFARPLHYLLRHGFRGDVYPVNPKYPQIAGLPTFADVAAIGRPVDLALLLVPAAAAVEHLRDLGAIGTRAAVVFASGFAEAGAQGKRLQDALVTEARRYGIRVLGPNCQGVIDMTAGLAATFTGAADLPFPQPNGVAYVGQSGAVGGSLLDLAREAGLGLSGWMSTGNEADIDSLEAAQFLLRRDDVHTVMLYLESSPDPSRYEHLGQTAATLGKHVVCLRTGRTAAGQRAVASHTGSIVGPDRSFRLLSERHGIGLVGDVDDLVRVGQHLNTTSPSQGHAMAVVTTSGGAGSLAADVLTEYGWHLPTLSTKTQRRLTELVPEFGAVANPVDVTAQLFSRTGGRFPEVCEVVLHDGAVDALTVLVTMATGEFGRELAEYVVAVRDRAEKPVHFVWIAGRALTVAGREALARAGMPVYDSVSDLARTLEAARRAQPRPASHADVAPARLPVGFDVDMARRAAGRTGVLTEWSGTPILDAFGIARPRSVLLGAPAEADTAARTLDPPYACKLQSPLLTHKTDTGVVRLRVATGELPGVVADLFDIAANSGLAPEDVEGVLVQEMAPPGEELLVSVLGSQQGFPPVATVGFGGLAAELDPDVVSLLLPVSRDDVVAALRSLRRGRLLFGYRGRPGADVDAVVDVVQSLSAVAQVFGPQLAELEINPLVVYREGAGAVALDFVARLAAGAQEAGT